MSKKNIPDGFEDFAHSINELSLKEKQDLKNSLDKYQSFELYSFLEEEVKRLESISFLLENTSYLLHQYPQGSIILNLKRKENEAQIENFIELLLDPKHNFYRSINEMFNDSF